MSKRERDRSDAASTPTKKKRARKSRPKASPVSSATLAKPAALVKRRKAEISYISEICDMMYTFGDVRYPSEETAKLIEDIVRQYLVDLVNSAVRQYETVGAREISRDDIVFQIRKNEAQVLRLQSYLTWKDLRAWTLNKGTAASAAAITKKSQLNITWDFLGDLQSIEGEEGEEPNMEPPEPDEETKERLRRADELTKRMSPEEYIEFSNRRKASFTYRKPKKFREWLSRYVTVKLNDDIISMLGYLAWEMVSYITQHSIDIKDEWESFGMYMHSVDAGLVGPGVAPGGANSQSAQGQHRARGDFQHDATKTPLWPAHVREMMRRRRPLCFSRVGYTATHRYQQLHL